MIHDIAKEVEKLSEELGVDRKRSIGEAAKELKVEPHVIRFWEEHFEQIKPEIGPGKRRYYYNQQIKILKKIKKFLYEDGYTTAGLQKLLSQRKHSYSKEEDLDIILKLSSDEKKIVEEPNNSRSIEFDDFIHPEIRVKIDQEFTGKTIDLQSRLKDFSNIKIAGIDSQTKQKVLESVQSIKKNLQRLKNL